MNEPNRPDDFENDPGSGDMDREEMKDFEDQMSVGMEASPSSYQPEMSGSDDIERKAGRGGLRMFIGFMVVVVVGGIIAWMWYQQKSEYDKWDRKLAEAIKLPDGEFEAALRDILAKSDSSEILAQTCFELGEAKDATAVPLLIKMISRGGTVAKEAARALAKMGDKAKEGIEPIYAEMLKSEGVLKGELAWALCAMGDGRGFGPLLEAMSRKLVTPWSIPNFDADVIMRSGSTEQLIEMAGNNDPMLRILAAMELGFRKDKDVVPALAKLTKDEKNDVAKAAAISLGRITDDRAGIALVDMVKAKPNMRDDILLSIAQSVGAPGLEKLFEKTDPKGEADFRLKIVGKLKTLKDPRSKDFLMKIVNGEIEGSDDIRDQALWTLEILGDGRIAEKMYQKTKWEPVTEEKMPDAPARYRQNDQLRKIANGAAAWFGQVKPEGAAEYVLKIYNDNQPYSNTPECAQRVKVDIGPLLDAMGKVGDPRFCPIIEEYLDKDEKFFFQAAALALARAKCAGSVDTFLKRMVMTSKERKEGKFSPLEETRDWQMEDRLQERRNSIIAVKYLGDPKVVETLMEIVMDVTDDQELRREAATTIAYCADEKAMDDILAKVKDASIDVVARASLAQGLWQNPNEKAIEAMFEVLEKGGGYEIMKPASIVIGEAGNSANDAKLYKLLDDPDETKQRAAAMAILLSGSTARVEKVLEVLRGQESALIIRDWYENHPVFLTKQMFENKKIYRRLVIAKALMDTTRGKDQEILWPWKYMMERLRNGWEDGPGGLTGLDVRNLLADTVRKDAEYRQLAAFILAGMDERGYLLTLQAETGPQADVARGILQALSARAK